MKQVNFKVEKELWDKVVQHCAQRQIQRSEFLREAILQNLGEATKHMKEKEDKIEKLEEEIQDRLDNLNSRVKSLEELVEY